MGFSQEAIFSQNLALEGFHPAKQMTNAAKTIENLHKLWNTGELSKVPSIYSEQFVAHMPKGWEQSEFRGHDGVRSAIKRIRSAFSNWHESIEDMIVDGEKVVTRYVSRGTHTGRFLGVSPTGRAIRIDEISIYHISHGLVKEQWCLTDDLTLAHQLGLIDK